MGLTLNLAKKKIDEEGILEDLEEAFEKKKIKVVIFLPQPKFSVQLHFNLTEGP